MRNYIFRFLIIFVAILLQSVIFTKFSILEMVNIKAKIDLALMLVIFFGLKGGIMPGQTGGFVAGLLEDLLAKDFGINMLIKTIIGFIAGTFNKKIYLENFLTSFFIVFIATLIKGSIFIIIKLFSTNFVMDQIIAYILNELLIEVLLNSLIAPFLFIFLSKFNIFVEKQI